MSIQTISPQQMFHCQHAKAYCKNQVVLAEKEAHKNIYIALNFAKTVLGIDLTLNFSVQWGKPGKANAYWKDKKLSFDIAHYVGDDNKQVRFSRDFTVVAHEVGHAVAQLFLRKGQDQLMYPGQPGAIEEFIADVFALMAKDWAIRNNLYKPPRGEPFWSIGDIVVRDQRICSKTMCKVHKRVIRSFTETKLIYQRLPLDENHDYGGVHINARILDRIFYDLCDQTTGGDPRKQVQTVGLIVLQTYMLLGKPYTFENFGKCMVDYLQGNCQHPCNKKKLAAIDMIRHIWLYSLLRTNSPMTKNQAHSVIPTAGEPTRWISYRGNCR